MKDGLTQVKELKDKIHEQYIEIQELNKARKTDIEYNKYLQKEIIRLNNRLKTSNETCNFLRNTIDKAIEYIDRRDIEWGSEEHEKLLSILKGENNE